MSLTKRQKLPDGLWPGLWVVATPIGNLGDLSSRARGALGGADAVLCEDTRRTGQLMSALGIPTRLERFDAHSPPERIDAWVERLAGGENLAMVTDAGTPGISDPAARLVAAARERGVRVVPVPGPSAVAALLSVCGFDETAFCFRGFFPRKDKERREELKAGARSEVARIFAWFESPERIVDALSGAAGPEVGEAAMVAAKELTKLHEKLFFGTAASVAEQVRAEVEREGAVGEWCFAIRFGEPATTSGEAESAWLGALHCLIDAQVPASDAARRIGQYFGVPRKTVYEAALRLSGKKI